MKTKGNKKWQRRNIFLAIQVFVLTLAFSFNGFGQEIADRISNTESLFEQMKVEQVDTNYTHKWNEDSSRWELSGRDIEEYMKSVIAIR